MSFNERQEQLCDSSGWNFSDLKAIFLNCTLKRSPELSHTEGLFQICKQIMEKNGVATTVRSKKSRRSSTSRLRFWGGVGAT